MKFYLGEDGLDRSYQQPFEKVVDCCRCGETARIAFVASEIGETGDLVCDLRVSPGPDGSLWPHDACCVAVYLCSECLAATAVFNQA